jgi:hypothetical protein
VTETAPSAKAATTTTAAFAEASPPSRSEIEADNLEHNEQSNQRGTFHYSISSESGEADFFKARFKIEGCCTPRYGFGVGFPSLWAS